MWTAVVPLKALDVAKGRLSDDLAPLQRRRLVVWMLHRVVAAAQAAHGVGRVVVVAGDDAAADAARGAGAAVLADPGGGLDAAVATADRTLGGQAVVVLCADLPDVTGAALDGLLDLVPGGTATAAGAVLVAAADDGGTAALLRRPVEVIAPAYGPDSAARHLARGRSAGAWTARVRAPLLARDVDRIGDLRPGELARAERGPRPT